MRLILLALIFGGFFIGCENRNEIASFDDGNPIISFGDSVIIKLFLSESKMIDAITVIKSKKMGFDKYDYIFEDNGFLSSSEIPIGKEKHLFLRYDEGISYYSAEIKDSLFDGLVTYFSTEVEKYTLQENGKDYYNVDSNGLIYAEPRIFEIKKLFKDSIVIRMSHDINKFKRVNFNPHSYKLIIVDSKDQTKFQYTVLELSSKDKVQTYGLSLSKFIDWDELIIMGNYLTDSLNETNESWRTFNIILDTVTYD